MSPFNQLLAELPPHITRITSDSRQVKPETIFVAISGTTHDGHDFVTQAAEQGAAFIIAEKQISVSLNVPVIYVENSRKALGLLAAKLHGNPSDSLLMIGVTGTSGKTTTTYIIESILKEAGYNVGVFGTVNFRFNGKELPSTHTTPDACELQRLIAEMKAGGCTAIVMEVSSHALAQERIAGIHFDAVGFLNLSPEHQDFHPDMEDYFKTKSLLFTLHPNAVKAINLEDAYGKRLFEELTKNHAGKLAPFSLNESLSISLAGIEGPLGGIKIQSTLSGRFNASNIAAAIAITKGLGIPTSSIQHGVATLESVPGRLERISNAQGIHVFVDYAHKPDALDKVLHALRQALKESGKPARLITVFGCGGDRDRKKRPVMGELAVRHSDSVWITSDNPRTENPDTIIAEIVAGTAGHSNFKIESDRKSAIHRAISDAQSGDVVLIAGKGHEDYQIIGKSKIHFDDREIAREALFNYSAPLC